MLVDLAWERETPVNRDELLRALGETYRALKLLVDVSVAFGEDDFEEDEGPARSTVVLRTLADDDHEAEVSVVGPFAISATAHLTATGLELSRHFVKRDWELAALSNGQPLVRRAESEINFSEPAEDLWLLPTWQWAPRSVNEVQNVFFEVRARAIAPQPIVDATKEQLTLANWLSSFSQLTGRLVGVRPQALVEADLEHAALLPEHVGATSRLARSDIASVLTAIASLVPESHEAHGLRLDGARSSLF